MARAESSWYIENDDLTPFIVQISCHVRWEASSSKNKSAT